MNDLISRAAALECFEMTNTRAGAKHAIETLQAVEPEPRWIPVTEQLPEDRTNVLVTIHTDYKGDKVRSSYYSGGYFNNDNGDCWKVGDEPLLAWMYQPEPYRMEGENVSDD